MLLGRAISPDAQTLAAVGLKTIDSYFDAIGEVVLIHTESNRIVRTVTLSVPQVYVAPRPYRATVN